MKNMTMRSLAWLTSLMLVVSIFAGVIVLPVEAATVNYVYSGNYVYNWGTREELATFLSPMAEDFYDENGVTYQQLAENTGASDVNDVPDSDLYDALHKLMYENLDAPTAYKATNELYRYTDCQNSGKDTEKISSFYSGNLIGPDWDGGSTWNKEHTWPNSKSNGGSDSNTQRETDIMMLRPTAKSENGSRSNTAYGESGSFYDPNEESNGAHNLHGDVARIVLYVYVCWGGSDKHDGALDYMWGASGVMESKDVLLKWMEEDPVDTWELGRNDAVEAITGTRNVFVDYPELAFLLFGEDVPDNYDSPSGEGTTAGYTVTASTNNSNYGTVSVSGNVITASPKTGYAATGYTILSGTATVTQNGNKFTVSPSSDVSVRINFGKREELTVQFVENGGVTSTQTAYAGDSITLPAHSGAVPDGQTFLGWCSYEVSETTDEPTYYAAGATWTASAGITLYALYARSEEGGVVNNNTYEPYSGALTEGDYIIVYNSGAMEAAKNGTASRLDVETITITNDEIQDPAAAIVWEIAKSGNYWTIYNASVDSYAVANGTKNQLVLGTAGTDSALWTATGDSTYEFVNVGNKAESVNANLRRNGTYGFACYSTSTGGALTLYKRQSGTLYYFTAQAPCSHEYDNACDADCNICGETREVGDHVYDNANDATCNACGAVRQIAAQVLSGGKTSVSEDVNGLAFFFTANMSGAQTQNGYEYVANSASVTPFVDGESYPVVRMGAVVSNGVSSVDIEAKYLWDVTADEASFAVRLINIPDNQLDREITARPYYVYEVDGEEIVVYGETVSQSYNAVAQ